MKQQLTCCALMTAAFLMAFIPCACEHERVATPRAIVMPQAMLVGAEMPATLAGPPAGRASISCDGVYMKCETRKKKTRCWCSDDRVIEELQ